jgi:hypothetical protein
LYSASLLDARKYSRIDWSMAEPSEVIITILAPAPLAFDASSTYTFHYLESLTRDSSMVGKSTAPSSGRGENSAMKSAGTCPLMVFLINNVHLGCLALPPFGNLTGDICSF